MFQLTTSRRGRRTIWFGTESFINVSTHDLTKRSTDILGSSLISIFVSTHDLTKRSTSSVLSSSSLLMFQLTTSRRGRPSSLSCKNDSMSFQLTTSRGRPLYSQYNPIAIYVSTHDLTKRSTFAVPTIPPNTVLFQLTTSRRGRLIPLSSHKSIHGVSTHDLTKRSTSEDISSFISEDVSTHDLTKRSTLIGKPKLILQIKFQLTTSRRGRRLLSCSSPAWRKFQLTTSRRGRPCVRPQSSHCLRCFNSRPHEEVDSSSSVRLSRCSKFQLTTSRRGRP